MNYSKRVNSNTICFYLIVLFVSILPISTKAQNTTEKMKTALIIIDIQQFYFPGENAGLYKVEETSLVAKDVLKLFRDNKQLVVHVRHKVDKNFEIHEHVKPLASEKIITKSEINAFNSTDLLGYLQENKITRLVLIGMQTNMCLEGATRAAYDFGFECLVIHDACTTKDYVFNGQTTKATDVHNTALATLASGGYAKVISFTDFSASIEKYLY